MYIIPLFCPPLPFVCSFVRGRWERAKNNSAEGIRPKREKQAMRQTRAIIGPRDRHVVGKPENIGNSKDAEIRAVR